MEWGGYPVCLARQQHIAYPARNKRYQLTRKPRLPVDECTVTPTELHELIHFKERRNLVYVRVPSQSSCRIVLHDRSSILHFGCCIKNFDDCQLRIMIWQKEKIRNFKKFVKCATTAALVLDTVHGARLKLLPIWSEQQDYKYFILTVWTQITELCDTCLLFVYHANDVWQQVAGGPRMLAANVEKWWISPKMLT